MSKIITKNGQTIRSLAAQFMLMNEGCRIPRVEDFSAELKVGRGTVQTALNFLREENAISLESSGHLGTRLISLDKKKLWAIAGYTSIVGTMPLPYSKRYEGLATALCEIFDQAEIPFSLAYQRGAENRINGVLSGRYDFAVCSKLSAEFAVAKNDELDIATCLGRKTFVGGHALILRDGIPNKIVDGMRIAVDHSSLDQVLLTQKLFQGRDVTLVDYSYNQLTGMLENSVVDGAIWNADEFEDRFASHQFVKLDLNSDNALSSTEATLVCKSSGKQLEMLFKEIIKSDKIIAIQNDVIKSIILPRY